MNRKLWSVVAVVLLAAVIPVSSWALSMPKDLLTYTVSVTSSGSGQLYWNYGKNMEFFLCNGSDAYNQNCRIKKSESYKFTTLIDRGIVPKADDGWFFDGFYDKSGARDRQLRRRSESFRKFLVCRRQEPWITGPGIRFHKFMWEFPELQN